MIGKCSSCSRIVIPGKKADHNPIKAKKPTMFNDRAIQLQLRWHESKMERYCSSSILVLLRAASTSDLRWQDSIK